MNKNKCLTPKKMELLFDALYLLTVIILSLYFLSIPNNRIVNSWGIMALILGLGDACHLLPRMGAILFEKSRDFFFPMAIGKLIASITMTIFYLLLWQIGLIIFSLTLPKLTLVLYFLAGLRIILCLLPQNRWTDSSPSYTWSIYRNIPFIIQGGIVLSLYFIFGSTAFSPLNYLWFAILLSFAFYIPVVLLSHKYPNVGMLMLPKSCAYIWIIAMGTCFL